MTDILERVEVEVGPGERIIVELGDRDNPKVRYVNNHGDDITPADQVRADTVGIYKLLRRAVEMRQEAGIRIPEEYIDLLGWCKLELGGEI